MRLPRNYLLSFLLGALLNTTFAPFSFLPIVIISFSGLIFLLNSSLSNKFNIGWYFGFGQFTFGLYWICNSLFIEIASFWWLVPIALTLIPAILSIYTGIVCWLFSKYSTKTPLDILLFSSLWVLTEYVRGKFFLPFPWNLTGYTLAPFDRLSQIASIIGVYGMSFLVVSFATSAYYIASSPRKVLAYSIFCLIPLITFTYGKYRLELPTQFTDYTIRLVQPNIEQKLKWLNHERQNHLFKQLNLTKDNQPQDLKLIIWPEAAINYNIESTKFREFITSSIPENSILILGGIHTKGKKFYNSIFALSKKGDIIDYYDKRQLVPFGEYLPFGDLGIPIISKYFLQGFSAGLLEKTFHLPDFPSFTPLLCYEVIFNELISKNVPRGTWILNITNDAWFGKSSGPYQHLAMAKIRAIEQGLPLVRVANTGISVIFDPFGRELVKTKLNETTVIDYKLPTSLPPTLFSKFANLPIILLSILIIIFSSRKKL
jgi:apolipoprotein N-acyltransferase